MKTIAKFKTRSGAPVELDSGNRRTFDANVANIRHALQPGDQVYINTGRNPLLLTYLHKVLRIENGATMELNFELEEGQADPA